MSTLTLDRTVEPEGSIAAVRHFLSPEAYDLAIVAHFVENMCPTIGRGDHLFVKWQRHVTEPGIYVLQHRGTLDFVFARAAVTDDGRTRTIAFSHDAADFTPARRYTIRPKYKAKPAIVAQLTDAYLLTLDVVGRVVGRGRDL